MKKKKTWGGKYSENLEDIEEAAASLEFCTEIRLLQSQTALNVGVLP